MKSAQYVGVCVRSPAVPLTYTGCQSLTQPPTSIRCSVPSLHSRTLCSFRTALIHPDLALLCSDNQAGKRVGVLSSPREGVRFSVWACDKVHVSVSSLRVPWLLVPPVKNLLLLNFLPFSGILSQGEAEKTGLGGGKKAGHAVCEFY